MNIYDIAREAGVSISTVSRVLNDHPNVRSNTRSRVVEVLNRHNYVPSSIAQSLVNKETRTIGVMVLDVRHMHYANIAFAIEQKLSSYGYNAILCNTGYDRSKAEDYVRVLAEKQVDGVIMVGSVLSCAETGVSIERYMKRTPVVMHNTTLRGENIYNTSTEEQHGIVLAVDHLVKERNIRNIAFVQDYDTTVGYAKHDVYRTKLEEYGIPYRKELAVRTVSGVDGGIAAADELLSRQIPFSALIGCDDITCLGAMRRLREKGLRVPEDVAVIGFNNTVFSRISDPPMTVIDNKEETTGIMLARAMADVLRGRDIPNQTLIYPELIIRGTA
jgi:LacI family transcriptional regulator